MASLLGYFCRQKSNQTLFPRNVKGLHLILETFRLVQCRARRDGGIYPTIKHLGDD